MDRGPQRWKGHRHVGGGGADLAFGFDPYTFVAIKRFGSNVYHSETKEYENSNFGV